MEPRDLRAVLKRQPFSPFRIHLTDGTIFEVRHPDMARLRRSAVTLSLPTQADVERWAVVPLSSILWVELLIGKT